VHECPWRVFMCLRFRLVRTDMRGRRGRVLRWLGRLLAIRSLHKPCGKLRLHVLHGLRRRRQDMQAEHEQAATAERPSGMWLRTRILRCATVSARGSRCGASTRAPREIGGARTPLSPVGRRAPAETVRARLIGSSDRRGRRRVPDRQAPRPRVQLPARTTTTTTWSSRSTRDKSSCTGATNISPPTWTLIGSAAPPAAGERAFSVEYVIRPELQCSQSQSQ
jgi:hypothetical protein